MNNTKKVLDFGTDIEMTYSLAILLTVPESRVNEVTLKLESIDGVHIIRQFVTRLEVDFSPASSAEK